MIFANILFFEIFKWNNKLYCKTGLESCREIFTKETVKINKNEKVIIF